jgi:uncharacterized membrane protein YhaH (DUF805 family)
MNWGKLLFGFDGRMSRKAFWLITLAMVVVSVILNVVALAPLMAAASSGDPAAMEGVSMPVWVWIVFIPMIWISIAMYVKRFHDQDRSGWFTVMALIPILNLVALIMAGFIAGTPGPNRFGEAPMA